MTAYFFGVYETPEDFGDDVAEEASSITSLSRTIPNVTDLMMCTKPKPNKGVLDSENRRCTPLTRVKLVNSNKHDCFQSCLAIFSLKANMPGYIPSGSERLFLFKNCLKGPICRKIIRYKFYS